MPFGRARGACVMAFALMLGTVGAAGAFAAPNPAPSAKPAASQAPPGTEQSTGYPRVMPLPRGTYRISASFGQAGSVWASGHHTGQDFGAAEGTPVLAAADGIVVFTGDGGRYGNLTEIAHADGVQTWYAHQSAITASVGAQVARGQEIGRVGQTGNAFGAHLHFEVRVGGQPVDPMPWLGGATAVAPADGSAVVSADPARAAQLRADLAAAESARTQGQAQASVLRERAAEVGRQAEAAEAVAARARQDVSEYAREVYKAGGVDPEWLLQADALSAGDPGDYSDRQVYLQYSNQAQNGKLVVAMAATKQAGELRDQVKQLLDQADSAIATAEVKMISIQAQLEDASWSWASAGQWDGVIPPGASAEGLLAVKFALSQIGHSFAPDGTGPDYDSDGLSWRAWNEAGSKWPQLGADDQATNRKWVTPVAAGQEQPGDVAFFRLADGSDPRPGVIDHVGIVVNPGLGTFVHASSPKTGVEINNYRTSNYYSGSLAMFGRVGVTKAPAERSRP